MNMSMAGQIELIARFPNDFTVVERERFQEIVAHAGEVIGVALATNIANARVLVMLKQDGIVLGVAALKRPQDGYREKIMQQTSVALPRSSYPYELGYIFIQPNLQGRGLSHPLVSKALAHSDGATVFATVRTDNVAMRATLYRAGFTVAGNPYLGLTGRQQPLGEYLITAVVPSLLTEGRFQPDDN